MLTPSSNVRITVLSGIGDKSAAFRNGMRSKKVNRGSDIRAGYWILRNASRAARRSLPYSIIPSPVSKESGFRSKASSNAFSTALRSASERPCVVDKRCAAQIGHAKSGFRIPNFLESLILTSSTVELINENGSLGTKHGL